MIEETKQPEEEDIKEAVPSAELVRRDPGVPIDLNELAALEEQGHDIVKARESIVGTLRLASIRLTNPEDWLLFLIRDKQSGVERTICYLQDSGCQRVTDIWGIQIEPGEMVRVEAGQDFAYQIVGDGFSRVTGRRVEKVEGLRYSTDDFVKTITSPIQKEMRVRQAARANLDGNIVRSLAGLKSVPIQELERAWVGTNKSTKRCSLGRGWGEKKVFQSAPPSEPPPPVDSSAPPPQPLANLCEKCGKEMVFRPAGEKAGKKWGPYWKCPDYERGNGHSAHNAEPGSGG